MESPDERGRRLAREACPVQVLVPPADAWRSDHRVTHGFADVPGTIPIRSRNGVEPHGSGVMQPFDELYEQPRAQGPRRASRTVSWITRGRFVPFASRPRDTARVPTASTRAETATAVDYK